ncbi:MAG: hypothetical protein U0572_11300 [Phycisphaerales bacterium]
MLRLPILAFPLLLCVACATDRECAEWLARAEPASLRDRVGEETTIQGVFAFDSKLGPVVFCDGGPVALEDYDGTWYQSFANHVGDRVRVKSMIHYYCESGPHPYINGQFASPELPHFWVSVPRSEITPID